MTNGKWLKRDNKEVSTSPGGCGKSFLVLCSLQGDMQIVEVTARGNQIDHLEDSELLLP